MRTYVKIEGKDVEPIVQKLAKLAVDLPEICVWDINIQDWPPYSGYSPDLVENVGAYFGMGPNDAEKHCDRIISKSGVDLGDASIYFEWLTPPSGEQLRKLRNMIDGILKPFGNKYTVTNKE